MTYLNKAVALRPVRVAVKTNAFIYYEGTTFPKHPSDGCDMYLRRLRALGYLADSYSPVAVDILDDNGDILETVMLSKRGFEYLRRKLRFRVESN